MKDTANKTEKKMTKNSKLILMLLILSCVVVVSFIVNMVNVWKTAGLSKGNESSMSTTTQRTLKNDLYVIGNNPTAVEKEYFQELTSVMKEDNKELYAERVAECFVTDYFTWNNKDGNYEVGGLQYIYAPKFIQFDDWSRWNYYKDLDLYIKKYGREKLPEVATVKLDTPVEKMDDYVVKGDENGQPYACYKVKLSWTYVDNSTVDLSAFPTECEFLVVDHDGRMEIVEMNDQPIDSTTKEQQ